MQGGRAYAVPVSAILRDWYTTSFGLYGRATTGQFLGKDCLLPSERMRSQVLKGRCDA